MRWNYDYPKKRWKIIGEKIRELLYNGNESELWQKKRCFRVKRNVCKLPKQE